VAKNALPVKASLDTPSLNLISYWNHMATKTKADYFTGLRYVNYWQAIGWMMVLIVILLSLTPKPPQLPGLFGWDKAHHFLAYAALMYWFGVSRPRHWRWPVFIASLGVVLELLQGLTGYRTSDPNDLIANTLGVAIGLFIVNTPLGGWLAIVDRMLAERLHIPGK
jgi:VanZ family protein